MNNRSIGLAGLASLLLIGCGGGGGGGGSLANTVTGPMELIEVSTGNGLLMPLQIFPPTAAGLPDTSRAPVRITSRDILTANLRDLNPVLPPAQWSSGPVLSTGRAGNHFVVVRFNQAIDIPSVLSDEAITNGVNNLTGAIEVVGINTATGQEVAIAGRGFVAGKTFGANDPMDITKRLLEEWVLQDGLGVALTPVIGPGNPGMGFPGTQSVVPGIGNLLSETAFVFVADSDGNLESLETFPAGVQIHVRFTSNVRSFRGRNMMTPGIAASRVSPSTTPVPDTGVINVMLDPTLSMAMTTPMDGDVGVDPAVIIELAFTKSVQINSVGPYEDGTPPDLASGVLLQYGTASNRVRVPYSVSPRSVYDFTHMRLRPIVSFIPGNPNNMDFCSNFSDITMTVVAGEATGLAPNSIPLGVPRVINFSVGEGVPLINNVVLPDAIYVGLTDSLGVVDLNGYGQGPGNPAYDSSEPIKQGNSNFPNNRNFQVYGPRLTPPLSVGVCTIEGGSEGVFTLCKDSALNDRLLGSPVIESVNDIAIGHSLDGTFNNGAPFGCQSGVNANTCASTAGLKQVAVITGPGSTLIPFDGVSFILDSRIFENIVSWASHPNPPPLIFPPACFAPLIGAAEPTSIQSLDALGNLFQNLQVPGNSPQGNPGSGAVPDGILARIQNSFFQGPSLPNADVSACFPYMIRQQIGQFMYVADRQRREIVVLNSNRFNVIDRIEMPDPTSFAMSPDLDFLAVTNQSSNQVFFLDTSPASPTFHQIVARTNVGVGPTGIAWTPGNEDILVCNTTDSTVSVLSAFTFGERKVISNQVRNPIEVAITARQVGFGRNRGVYFGYILNADGSLAVFESGPDGVSGIGFDDVIQSLPFRFDNPKTIQTDSSTFNSQVWVVHENQLQVGDGMPTGRTGGAVSVVRIASGLSNPQTLATGALGNASARDLQWDIALSIGSDQLSGIPVDIAFDNLVSRTASRNLKTPFSSRGSLENNGKSIVRSVGANNLIGVANDFEFVFLAVPNSSSGSGGAIDVIDRTGNLRVDTNLYQAGVQSIPANGATVLADFFRQ